ncbi:L-methionine/branched-chain amino acid transporter [Pseudoalteromonas sp. G4]|uniref:L-methionine/branched-chain amino acid transporter n=1 Tax=Pseudoalteromonas sp. G4 TaxID=2992761 RepID=UPI00237DC291|nr:L-methionine/branched-chain amino acid transporter [Pseudoalteromonas sp. G4]MDE3273717.1 L-methionine/branched-chain amino acid transporter [Pseudoalteromonas sp. G4]
MNLNNNGIGRWQGAGMMATTLLGTGVFILPQLTVEMSGSNAVFAWLLLTIGLLPMTYIFGKLSSIHPHSRGPAYFVEKAFGETAGRVIGLMFLLVVPIGTPAAVIMTFQFVQGMIAIDGFHLLIAELSALAGLYLLNRKGIHVSAKLQFLLTLLIVAIVMVLFASSTGQPNRINPTFESFDNNAVFQAAGLAFWSFLGVEAMSHLANEFKRPNKDVIPAMIIGSVLVGIIYIASTLLVLNHPNDAKLAIVGVFDTYFSSGSYIIGILGVAGGLATINVYTASLAKLVASFAEQGVLPRVLAQSNQQNVPQRALSTVLSIMALVLVITHFTGQDLEDLINWVNGVFAVIYLATMASAWVLLTSKHRLSIMLGFLACFGLVFGIGPHMFYAILLIAILLPIVKWQKRKLVLKQQLNKLA